MSAFNDLFLFYIPESVFYLPEIKGLFHTIYCKYNATIASLIFYNINKIFMHSENYFKGTIFQSFHFVLRFHCSFLSSKIVNIKLSLIKLSLMA